MAIVAFLLGLGLGSGAGLALWLWQRTQFDHTLNDLLEHPQFRVLDRTDSPLTSLINAIAYQKKRATQLESALDACKQALNLAPIGYLLVNQDNQLLFCNSKACQLLEIQDWQQATQLLLEVVRSYEVDQLIENARRSQKICEKTWNFYPVQNNLVNTAHVPTRLLRGMGLPLPDQQVGVFIEDRQEVMLADQQRDLWASDVAHELKTPLTSIRLITETLQSRTDPAQRHWLDRLLKEVVRLSSLVEDLLELSTLKSGMVRSQKPQRTDLVSLINLTWGSLEPLSSQKQLALMYRGPSTLILQADESRFHRLLLNLLDNSIKFSYPQQTIRVELSIARDQNSNLPDWLNSSEDRSNWIYLQVIDSGCGFNEQDLPYVFDRFYRSDTSRSRSVAAATALASAPGSSPEVNPVPQQGSGLGLAIARQIVEANHGVIHARNHPVTGGAWLEVLLPWNQNSL